MPTEGVLIIDYAQFTALPPFLPPICPLRRKSGFFLSPSPAIFTAPGSSSVCSCSRSAPSHRVLRSEKQPHQIPAGDDDDDHRTRAESTGKSRCALSHSTSDYGETVLSKEVHCSAVDRLLEDGTASVREASGNCAWPQCNNNNNNKFHGTGGGGETDELKLWLMSSSPSSSSSGRK
uniref:Uncharacterized protein n=1 Tax=Globodera rostochiensis TaxID=31243 RepID=A0A914I8V7_GLORO